MRYTVELNDATQYATVYDQDERPVATLRRRHSFDPKDAPRWTLFDTHGMVVTRFYLPSSYEMLIRKVNKILDKINAQN
jgi:hypothetical protein